MADQTMRELKRFYAKHVAKRKAQTFDCVVCSFHIRTNIILMSIYGYCQTIPMVETHFVWFRIKRVAVTLAFAMVIRISQVMARVL